MALGLTKTTREREREGERGGGRESESERESERESARFNGPPRHACGYVRLCRCRAGQRVRSTLRNKALSPASMHLGYDLAIETSAKLLYMGASPCKPDPLGPPHKALRIGLL